MTVILAIPAANGLVLASDGQITFSDGIRATGKKIFRLKGKCLWAASGRNALIQRVQERLPQACDGEVDLDAVRDRLATAIRTCVGELHQLDQQPLQDDFVFVQYLGTPRILHINAVGTPEWITTGAYAIGIGRVFAHALLQKYANLVPGGIDVMKAALLAFKVIEEAIEVGGYGLGPPIDVWQLAQNEVRNLDDAEIGALQDAARGLRQEELRLFLTAPGQP